MSDVAESIRLYLINRSGVAALVGNRIYADVIKQGAQLPAVAFSKLSTRHDHQLSGFAGLAHSRLQFDCYADRNSGGRTTANKIAKAIRTSGLIGTKGLTHGTDIRGVRMEEGERNEVDFARDGSDEHRYVTSFDIEVDYVEEI